MTTIHECPRADAALTPCCGRTPLELPRTDRMTMVEAQVTCHVLPRLLGVDRAHAAESELARLRGRIRALADDPARVGAETVRALLEDRP